jgi:hypothetical protein
MIASIVLFAQLLSTNVSAKDNPFAIAPIAAGSIAHAEPGRYRTYRTFEETLDFYERSFKKTGGIRWRSIINLPGIRARHIECLRSDSTWEGINVYEHNGKVHIFVIQREGDNKSTKVKAGKRKPEASSAHGAKLLRAV